MQDTTTKCTAIILVRDQVFNRLSMAMQSPDESEIFDRRCDKAETAFMNRDYDRCVELLELLGF